MIPRLQAFYGGDPRSWLYLPLRWLNCFADQLDVLMAVRALEQIRAVQVGHPPRNRQEQGYKQQAVKDLERIITKNSASAFVPIDLSDQAQAAILSDYGIDYYVAD